MIATRRLAFALTLALSPGCGAGMTNMDTAIAVRGMASQTAQTVKADWLKWDAAHQHQILVDSKQAGRASYDRLIANYRDQIQRRVDQGIKDAFAAVEALDLAIKVAKGATDGGLVGAIAVVWVRLGALGTILHETGVDIPIPAILVAAPGTTTNLAPPAMSAKSKDMSHG